MPSIQTTFRSEDETDEPKSPKQLNKELLSACADVAWWFGWSVQDIYEMPLDEFADWLDEVNRQIKAKYQKG